MSVLTCTYDNALGRVICVGSSLDASATLALFEQSTDQVHWFTVRGGGAVPIVAGTATVSDYEFVAGVSNYYRVSTINTGVPTYVGVGAAAVAVGVAVTPALPTYIEGDLLLAWAVIRNSGTGAVVCPTGWTVMLQVDNIGLFGRRAGVAGTETAPVVGVTGGVTGISGSDVIAQIACFRNCERTPAALAYQLNPSTQNIPYPGLSAVQRTWAVALYLGWRQDDWTSVATVTGGTAEIAETNSTGGLDMGTVWDYQLMAAPAAVPPGAFVVTGGAPQISYGATIALRAADFVTRTTTSIIPAMDHVWLKFVGAPYANRTATLTDWDAPGRTSRVTTFPIVGKSDPIAVTDLHSPYATNISVYATGAADIASLDLVLSLGSVVFLHIPPACQLPSFYASIGNYNYARPAARSANATFSIPLTKVQAPDGTIVGVTVTYAALVNRYRTYQDVINANTSYTAILALIGQASDALVGA